MAKKKVKHGQLDSLRTKSYKGSTSEWEDVLSRTLLHTPIPEHDAQAFEGLDLVSSVTEDSGLTILWRRKKRGTYVRFNYPGQTKAI